MKDVKTADQLRREITYFVSQAKRTTSKDRIRRARVAVRVREKLLTAAVKREAGIQ